MKRFVFIFTMLLFASSCFAQQKALDVPDKNSGNQPVIAKVKKTTGRNIQNREIIVKKDIVLNQFFQRTTGWIASDGALSIPLSDGRILWLMGDSHIDDYDTSTGTIPGLFQVRNAALLQPAGDWDWTHTQTLTGKGPGFRSLFKKTAADNYWFWPGNGIQLKDTVYVYCSELETKGKGTFGFAGTGKDMWAKMEFPEMKVITYSALPDFKDINFGAGFIKDESTGYVYAYGQKLLPFSAESEVYVARFPIDDPNAPWEYWGGNIWNKDIANVTAIGKGAVSPHVSKVKDKYVLLSTQLSVACDQGREIYISTSKHFNGPFSEKKILYTIDDTLQGHYPFFYTVAAHPEITNKDGFLVTYCINGYEPCIKPSSNGRFNPDYYRPKGVRVSFR